MTPQQRRWLLAAILFTVVIRLGLAVVVTLVRDDDKAAFHTPDSALYLQLGDALARFQGYGTGGTPELFRLPGYPLLVAVGSWLGDPTIGTIVVQAFLGGLTVWVCFLWGRAVAGIPAGLWAAWIYALEPGGWAWSTLVLTETLFTLLLASSLLAATAYLRSGRLPALLCAVTLASACAYVRIVGYPLPGLVLGACVLLAPRAGTTTSRSGMWRHAVIAAVVMAVILGAWHVRNGVRSGYWGFSTQVERAAYFTGGGSLEARTRGSYGDAVLQMHREVEATGNRAPAAVAADMRRIGLERIARRPFAFLSTYVAGIATSMLHPGTGAMLRLFQPNTWDAGPSVTQMMTLGRWRDAWRLTKDKGMMYWFVTILLFATTLVYLGLFLAGAWAGRSSPLLLLPLIIAAGLLLCSGGPDGDSRRRAPLVPLVSVIAAPLLARRNARSESGVPLSAY